jgi:hypothetical protein
LKCPALHDKLKFRAKEKAAPDGIRGGFFGSKQ